MARPSAATASTSGAKTVTVSDEIGGDLHALLDGVFSERERRDGETTAADEANRQGITLNMARDVLEGLVRAGKLKRRRPGNVVFYSKA